MRIGQASFTILLLFFILSVPQKAQAGEDLFFDSLYDIPVMAGLTEVKEMGLSFDKAEGRIAYAVAVRETINEGRILAFYGEVLPQMGWQGITLSTFTREKEKLEISFEKTETSNLVKFSLRPISR